jgi:hypothetical protein
VRGGSEAARGGGSQKIGGCPRSLPPYCFHTKTESGDRDLPTCRATYLARATCRATYLDIRKPCKLQRRGYGALFAQT